ncbi:uncharacterized protein [Dermacentor albipictus]|uniref:uncharacterized protein isoform X2 n=1 Tax=Dermacentor albipictus TaxID=60249 RepID=UPI0038FC1D20
MLVQVLLSFLIQMSSILLLPSAILFMLSLLRDTPDTDSSQIEYIYRLSYLWYSFLGAVIVLVLGSFISLLTIRWSKPVEERLLIRITCKCSSRRGTERNVKSPSISSDGGPFFVEPILPDSSHHNLAQLGVSNRSSVTPLTTGTKQKRLKKLIFQKFNGTVQNKVSNGVPPQVAVPRYGACFWRIIRALPCRRSHHGIHGQLSHQCLDTRAGKILLDQCQHNLLVSILMLATELTIRFIRMLCYTCGVCQYSNFCHSQSLHFGYSH